MIRRIALPHAYRALRYRNFRLYFFGLMTSAVGSWMETTAQSWLIFRLTHSSFLLGLVGFASQFPVFVLSLFGGVLADRVSRQKLIIITQGLEMVQAFILAYLTLTHRITVNEILILAVCLGVLSAFDIPARHSFMIEMVEPEALSSTIAMNSTAFTAARMIGPPLAAFTIALSSEGMCFLINGLSFLAVLWALLLIRVKPFEYEMSEQSPLSSLWEGIQYVNHFLPVKALLLLLGLVNFMGVSYAVLLPVFAEKILHRGSTGLGILGGAVGLGALLGAYFVGTRRQLLGVGRQIVFSCMFFALSLILFTLSENYALSIFLLVFVGFGLMTQTTSTSTMIQSLVPNALRGRVMSLYAITVVGLTPFGSLIVGSLAERWGAPHAVQLGAGFCFAGALWFGALIPKMRPLVRKTLHFDGAEN